MHYLRRPELETAEEKLAFLASHPMRGLAFDEVQPDKNANWVNLTNNDFETLLPLASKETKAAKTAAKERAIFKLYGQGLFSGRDEWLYDPSGSDLETRMRFFLGEYEHWLANGQFGGTIIKWSRNLKRRLEQKKSEPFNQRLVRDVAYRPYVKSKIYWSPLLVDEQGQAAGMFTESANVPNPCISVTYPGSQKPVMVCGVDGLFDYHYVGAAAISTGLPLVRFDAEGNQSDNITDWALNQFTAHYKEAASTLRQAQDRPSSARTGAGKAKKITKQAIFHYCYAVLHDPVYREKYAQNLKREFPRIPFYGDFWQWAAWGEALMALHIGYETVAPFALARHDEPDTKARAAGLAPKALLRSDPAAGSIMLDTETTLRGVPPEAWAYQLGNRCALDWVLDQYKEKKPKDPTIREKFDTYRFCDYKEKVIDLLLRVTTVSVETVRIVAAMKAAGR
ncbi:MAG: type ISP restriction/modification enzyme [Burkholderiales bacterium]|nr:type ISP restriction/modification enzyme [Burkholderiales bacterium]